MPFKYNKNLNILYANFAIIGFLLLNPYFTWTSYHNGIFNNLSVILSICLIILYFVFYLQFHKIKFRNILIGLTFFTLVIILTLSGIGKTTNHNYLIATIIYTVVVFCFFTLNEIGKKKVFNYFKILFTISLLSSILFFIILNLGISIPYHTIDSTHSIKASKGLYYIHLPGSVFLSGSGSSFFRLSGMFDEPGVVGTVSALLLVGDKFQLKNRIDNIIILIAGIFSFSLAFFLLTIIGLFFINFKKGIIRLFIFLITIIIVIYVLIFVETNNYFIQKYVQSRLFVDEEIIVSNRAGDSFEYGFELFLEDDLINILFGNGDRTATNNPYMSGSYYYKMLIYDYGYIGFLFIISWLVISGFLSNRNNKGWIILLVIFLISMYQRPYILSLDYMIILFGGYINLNELGLKNPVNKDIYPPKKHL